MSISVKAISNCDDVFLAWNPNQDIPACLGFSIERKRNGHTEVLENRVGFGTGQEPLHMPSTEFPFQRLSWTDHGANLGDTVSYRVTARVGTVGHLAAGPSSEWTDEITLTATYGPVSAYFNRGTVLSQFMGRLMKQNNWSVSDIKPHAAAINDSLREFLGGDLRRALLDILNAAIHDTDTEIHAALFELTDKELLDKLVQLGSRLHIVLGNGAVKTKTADENADARTRLRAAGANVFDRMSAPSFLAHNKFLVVSRQGQGSKVWTGSANWMPTGLCTQANNGVLIRSESLADEYLEAWQRLADSGNGKPAKLREANTATPPNVHTLADASHAFVQFTCATNQIDLDELKDLIAGAKQSLIFAMFMPGASIFQAATARSSEIFVRGVANTFPKPDENQVKIDLVNNGTKTPFKLTVVEPEGIQNGFGVWAAEVTKNQFSAIGHAIIHSKVLVIDAFGDNPTIVTGSHNFSITASKSNDENFVVISGNRKLAEAYAVNCLGLYDHYRWRKYVMDCEKAGRKPWSHLSSNPNWLHQYRKSEDRRALLQALHC